MNCWSLNACIPGVGEKALERSRAALQQGRADGFEVLVVEARRLSLRDRWLERRMDYARLEAQLEIAVGEASP